jgi:curved DNA-binding protein
MNADTELIRRAYRNLAHRYHPDHNPNDPEAEDRFKAINEAYQVLSDPHKRMLYNQYGEEWRRHVQATVSIVSDSLGSSSWHDQVAYTEPLSPLPQVDAPRPRHMQVSVRITLEEAYHGAVRTFHEGPEQVDVAIPPGVETGNRLYVPGAGGPGDAVTLPGDLFLQIVVLPHERFARSHTDLRLSLRVDPELPVRGGSLIVPTLAGPVYLTIPPCTHPGATFRLQGLGMPHLYLPHQRGDLYVKIVC